MLLPSLLILLILSPLFYIHYKDWGESSYVSWLELPAGCEIEANRTIGLNFWPEGPNNLARVRCPYDPVTALEKFKAAFEKRGTTYEKQGYDCVVAPRAAGPDDLAIRSYLPESLKKGLYDARQQRPDGVFFMRLSDDMGMLEFIFFAWATTDGSVVEIISEQDY